jgi:predicted amidohydrolase YtcJ
LELLNITPDTPQRPGGQILWEEGIFFDNAMDLVLSAIPAPDKEDVKAMIRAACRSLNRRGITGCHSDDYSTFQNLPWQTVNEAFRELEEAGELTLRVYEQANFPTLSGLKEFVTAGNTTGVGSDRFRIGPLKLLGDGALGTRTAYLSRPYADAPDTRGLSVFTAEAFDSLIGYAHEQGMQVAVHCIGDACLDLVLNSIEKALTANPRQDHRHGIVHCQITRPDQLDRIAKLGLHVYAQSIFLDYDIHIVECRAGEELAASSYSWKTLMDKGVTVSNGSDCPVETPDVLAGIQCAVTRRDLKGSGPYLPGEAFTVEQALNSYTTVSAHAGFEEGKKGRIAPGMLADFVVLGSNPFKTDPSKLKDIPVLGTYLDGKEV